MKKRSESFDEVAEIYDQARPGYPDKLIEDIIEMANLQDSSSISYLSVLFFAQGRSKK